MKTNMPQLSLFMLAILVISCGGPDPGFLRVTSALPSGVVGRDAVISLTFSRGVVPQDSVNQLTATPYIEFTPSIPGKFVWEDTTKLVFSPDGQLTGDTRFTAKINTKLLASTAGATGYDGPDEFSFSTESFTLKQAEFFYDRIGEKREVGIRMNLEFTYAVNPQDIPGALTLTIDKAPQKLNRVVTNDPGRVIAVEVGTVKQLDRPREMALTFSDGLVSPETGTRLRMEKAFTTTMAALGELQILGHEFGTDGSASWIKIRTSQEVDQAVALKYVKLDPVRPFTVRNDGDGFTLQGAFEPGAAFRLVAESGMESVLGGKTLHPYEADIVIGNVAPSFGFSSPSGVYMLLGGAKKIDVKTVNMNRLAVRFSQVFQNNLVFFLDGGRYYDYSYGEYDDEEGEGGRAITRKYRYMVGNYGHQLRFDTLKIDAAVNREVTTQLDLSPVLGSGYKGFYVVEIADPAQAWRSTSKLISVSDLGLIVKQSGDEVLVFVTNLMTTEPASGVQVSLISTSNQVIVSGKTDGSGVARFSNYRTSSGDFTLKLVTAEAENDFNFINLDDYRVETSRYDVAGRRDAGGQYDAVLYGDRNIYRPGEKMLVSGVVRAGDAGAGNTAYVGIRRVFRDRHRDATFFAHRRLPVRTVHGQQPLSHLLQGQRGGFCS
jgi:hypothetical protein